LFVGQAGGSVEDEAVQTPLTHFASAFVVVDIDAQSLSVWHGRLLFVGSVIGLPLPSLGIVAGVLLFTIMHEPELEQAVPAGHVWPAAVQPCAATHTPLTHCVPAAQTLAFIAFVAAHGVIVDGDTHMPFRHIWLLFAQPPAAVQPPLGVI